MLRGAAVLVAVAGWLASAPADDAAKSLAAWRDDYVSGRIELGGPAGAGSRATAIYGRLVPDRDFATHFDAFRMLCDAALEHQDADVARELVRLAAVDADVTRRPDVVRAAAVSTIGQLTATEAVWVVMRTAAGDEDGWQRWRPALQAAALRGLGAAALPVARPAIEKQLCAEEPEVRVAAAEALAAVGRYRSLAAIRGAVASEADGRVLTRLIDSAHTILGARCDVAEVRSTVLAVCAAIGRTDWHADLAAVELVADFRAEAAVEPLVRILERFHESPEDVDRGKLSGLLRHRAHEVLESLTGARIPATEPELWRAFWDAARDGFVLAAEPQRAPTKTTSGFFGIPIVGTRVVFVIDRSGSMTAQQASDDGRVRTRFQWAREELLSAVRNLPPDTQFNVVTFAEDVRAWRRGFASATAANASALAAKLGHTRVLGGTNIHGALDRALSLRVPVFGARYDSPVDEVFLLSDGEPTVGAVTDPDSILAIVREWNRYRGVRINTIFIGNEFQADLMRRLAAENGGQFVLR